MASGGRAGDAARRVTVACQCRGRGVEGAGKAFPFPFLVIVSFPFGTRHACGVCGRGAYAAGSQMGSDLPLPRRDFSREIACHSGVARVRSWLVASWSELTCFGLPPFSLPLPFSLPTSRFGRCW